MKQKTPVASFAGTTTTTQSIGRIGIDKTSRKFSDHNHQRLRQHHRHQLLRRAAVVRARRLHNFMLAIQSTNIIDYTLTDGLTGEPIEDATIEGVIVDKFGEEVTSFEMTHIEDGLYRVFVPPIENEEEEPGLVLGQIYKVALTIESGEDVLYDTGFVQCGEA